MYASMIANSQAAYSLLQQTLPIFVQLASKYSHLWSPNRTILISQALYRPPNYYICKFVFYDTMAALALARSPLVQYDTRSSYNAWSSGKNGKALEWVYGCSLQIVVFVAKINAWRVGAGVERWIEDWREVEGEVIRWAPLMDYVDDSIGQVMRLAVQESWRHAVLIYLYMVSGFLEMDSR